MFYLHSDHSGLCLAEIGAAKPNPSVMQGSNFSLVISVIVVDGGQKAHYNGANRLDWMILGLDYVAHSGQVILLRNRAYCGWVEVWGCGGENGYG